MEKDEIKEIQSALNKIGIVPTQISFDRLPMGPTICGFSPTERSVTIRGLFSKTPIKARNPIQKVVSNKRNGYTIVKFTDGTVSKVKCNNEDFDVEKAVAMAICKHLIGNHDFYEVLDNALIIEKEEEKNG